MNCCYHFLGERQFDSGAGAVLGWNIMRCERSTWIWLSVEDPIPHKRTFQVNHLSWYVTQDSTWITFCLGGHYKKETTLCASLGRIAPAIPQVSSEKVCMNTDSKFVMWAIPH